MLSHPSIEQQIEILSRRCERILSVEELKQKLKSSAQTGRPLRVKLGMDPTAPDVTLGHAVPLGVIRQFQEWGHKAVLIIGDYTARVGDPTGRSSTRPQLSGEQIDANAKTYVAQVGKLLRTDADHLEIRWNGEWLAKMNLIDIIQLAARKTVAQVLQRDDFANRFAENRDIYLHEMIYPLLQGWDSVVIGADVEMGGSDQLFNNLVGREFQKEQGQSPQVVMVTPLLVGTDGVKKMSKSLGNYIGVTDTPGGQDGIFGKIMSLPDGLQEGYYRLLTDESPEQYMAEIQQHPRDAKIRLAKLLIERLHDRSAADAAEAAFIRQFVQRDVPSEVLEVAVGPGPLKIGPLLVKAGLVTSNGEAMRKVKEGAVYVDGAKVIDLQIDYTLDQPKLIKLGRRYVRLKQ